MFLQQLQNSRVHLSVEFNLLFAMPRIAWELYARRKNVYFCWWERCKGDLITAALGSGGQVLKRLDKSTFIWLHNEHNDPQTITK